MAETVITPSSISESDDPRPVRIQYGDVRMRLPRLNDSTQLPLTMISAGLMVVSKGWDNLTQEEEINFMAVILAYLIREYPLLEIEMDRKSGDKLKDIGLIVNAWADASVADPKA
jgi:hypothetical protein|nr:MAG TPA: hypothetical protein [Caudoviricetes sp.]